MSQVNMNLVDLNLLRVFDALLEEGSVTRAGARLGLSQSAVSHALGRLRELMGDELFVRTGAGVRPTSRATEIGPNVHSALRQLQAALSVQGFDPAVTERRFTLMAGAFSSAVIIPLLVAEMAKQAPRAELVIAENTSDILEQLDSRRVDFVVGSIETAPTRVQSDVLLRETLVWVVRTGHPLTKGKITLERLVKTPHVAIRRRRVEAESRVAPALLMRASWEDLGAFENELRESGLTRKIGVTVPDAYSALAVVRRSDMAALIPRRLAEMSAQSGFLAMVRPPYRSPTVELNLLYLRERLAEPALKWMHSLLGEIGKTLESM
jgi:DNA-binding transcriptional LysR family regulator